LTNWLLGVALGLVQGISEWLPVSSKTQIIIFSTYVFHLEFRAAYAFGLFLEAGTFIAAVVYFRREVTMVLRAVIGRGGQEGRVLLRFLLVVTVITAIIAVPIYELVSRAVSGPVIGVPMVVLGLVLIVDGFLISFARAKYLPKKGLLDMTVRDWVLIGVAQGLAALPGVSRSGMTVSAMLLLGIRPAESFRLSFLALIPASVGASLLSVVLSDTQLATVVGTVTIPIILTAIVTAALVSLGLIRLLLRFSGSSKITLLVFGLGAVAIFSGITTLLSGFGYTVRLKGRGGRRKAYNLRAQGRTSSWWQSCLPSRISNSKGRECFFESTLIHPSTRRPATSSSYLGSKKRQ
jgi:undecaprenyl-diphosphatase